MIPGRTRPLEILLVEDNPGDVRLTQEALKEGRLNNNLNVVKDGEEALDYLYRKGEYKDSVRPDIILLDLNMPKKSGQEVLAEIKEDDELKSIPVIVLTTSAANEDIARSYNLHANCYITKPMDIQYFIKIIDCINDFWCKTVKLPGGE